MLDVKEVKRKIPPTFFISIKLHVHGNESFPNVKLFPGIDVFYSQLFFQ